MKYLSIYNECTEWFNWFANGTIFLGTISLHVI